MARRDQGERDGRVGNGFLPERSEWFSSIPFIMHYIPSIFAPFLFPVYAGYAHGTTERL
jgi:hypothetical protein